jgi:hypothetical protein
MLCYRYVESEIDLKGSNNESTATIVSQTQLNLKLFCVVGRSGAVANFVAQHGQGLARTCGSVAKGTAST